MPNPPEFKFFKAIFWLTFFLFINVIKAIKHVTIALLLWFSKYNLIF